MKIDELNIKTKQKALTLQANLKQKYNIDIIFTQTYRSLKEQDELYAQGRTKAGPIVTNARGGWSYHNWRCAFDVVPLVKGKPKWDVDDSVWKLIADEGQSLGLEAGYYWTGFQDRPHFQFTEGKVIDGKTNRNDFLTNKPQIIYTECTYGDKGDNVLLLQNRLVKEGLLDSKYTTGYYGSITAKAVNEFQNKYKIGTWMERQLLQGARVGKKTVEYLNRFV